ncbi:MAG: hypothetical protein ACSHWS_01955 [Sulfitobacter sp.]
MLGVVLWSDQEDRKAVFWCEDHGDLAYYEASNRDLDTAGFFDTGDMVQFDVAVERRLRRAFNPRMVGERACAGLPETLKRAAPQASPQVPRQSAEIIVFHANDKDTHAPLSAMKA